MAHGDIKFFQSYGSKTRKLAPLVIVFFYAIAGLLNLSILGIDHTIPQLEKTIADKSVPFFPDSNPGVVALKKDARDFHKPVSSGLTSVVFEDEKGISEEDDQYYQRLLKKLDGATGDKESDHVAYVIDIYNQREIRDAALSKDKKAVFLTVMLKGELGSSDTQKAWEWLKDVIKSDELHKPSDLKVYVTGATPIFIEELNGIDKAMLTITMVSVVVILIMLLWAYRSFVTALVPMLNIGVSLAISRAVISFLGQHYGESGFWGHLAMPISSFSNTMSTAIILGAGTDYAIFIIGRYHEGRKNGVPQQEALANAIGNVSGIIIASGFTIATASASMMFMKVGMFRTAGPPIAVGVIITLIVSLFFVPALIAIGSRFGFLEPREKDNSQYWRNLAEKVLARPANLFFKVIAFLIFCSLGLLGMKVTFLENTNYSQQAESNRGFKASDRHFGPNAMLPEFFVVHADHDMRNSRDLGALELAAAAVDSHPMVDKVQSITRPAGTPLPETTVSGLSGQVGQRLQKGIDKAVDNMPLLRKLATGAAQIYQGVSGSVNQLPPMNGPGGIASVAQNLIGLVTQAENTLGKVSGGDVTLYSLLENTRTLSINTLEMVKAFGPDNIKAVSDANNFLQEMDRPFPSPRCQANPQCMMARGLFQQINHLTNNSGHKAAQELNPVPQEMHQGYQRLMSAQPQLRQLNQQMIQNLSMLKNTDTAQMRGKIQEVMNTMKELQSKMGTLVGGLDQVRGGTNQAYNMSLAMVDKLQEAADFLNNLDKNTDNRNGGYHMPQRGFKNPKYVEGVRFMMSDDGKAARFIVTFTQSPMDPKVFNSLPVMKTMAKQALQGTKIENAEITSSGSAGIFYGFKPEVYQDTTLLATVAILSVLLILMFLLRCILAPIIVMTAVLVSFATTIGLTVLIFTVILHQPLHWSVVPISLMTIIAVGSDYSMLFVSRIRDEVEGGFEEGMIKAFETTGSVITTAGIVFAVTMFALIAGGLHNLQQIGVAIGTGLLIDILFVRTICVPAIMVLLRERVWWPANKKKIHD